MSHPGSMVPVSKFTSHNLVQISRTHPGGIHTEYRGHGQPGLQHGCPGDIYINTDPQKLEVFARLVDSWTPWKGPLYRNDFIHHPTNNELSLWCLKRTGPNWCRSSQRHAEYDPSLGARSFEAAFCISEYLKCFQVQTELQGQKITHSHNNDQVPYNSVGSTDSLAFPQVRLPRTFQVSNITNAHYYRADSNGVYTVPFSHFWSTSRPAPQTGNLGDFFFFLSPERHQIFIKLQAWVEWPGLNLQEPRLVSRPDLNDVVAWIDESQATWVSTSNFMASCEALRQTKVPDIFMSPEQCITHLLPKLPDGLSMRKFDVELLRSRNLELSAAHAKLLEEVSHSSQYTRSVISSRFVNQETTSEYYNPLIVPSPQYSSSAVQTECMLYCDRGCSPIQGDNESHGHRKNSPIVASAHAVVDDHSCTTTSRSKSTVSSAARDPCATISSMELQNLQKTKCDFIDDLDTIANPSSFNVDGPNTEEETYLASLSEPCAIEVSAVQESSFSGNKTVDPSSSGSVTESTLVDNVAIQTQNFPTSESASCERYQFSTPLSDSNSIADSDSHNKIKKDGVLLLLSSDLNFSLTTNIVDYLLSIIFYENQSLICRLCLQFDPPHVVDYPSSTDKHDLLLHCDKKHTAILQTLLSLSQAELCDIRDRLSAM